jgi:phosphoglycerol transferase
MQIAPGKLRCLVEYLAAVVLCLLMLVWVMKLWRADLNYPFTYFGDALLNSVATKGAIEQGWWVHNAYLAAPSGMNCGAYPAIDNSHFLLIKAISMFTGDYARTLNLFYLLTFPLTTLASLYFFRYQKISYGVSLTVSFLFTFLPYHFFRSYHLFLAAYYPLPLMILVIVWICTGTPFLFEPGARNRLRFKLKSRKAVFAIVVCAFVGGCGLYYPFFSCFFLVMAGAFAAISRKTVHPILTAITLAAFVSVVVCVNNLPLLKYRGEHGTASMGSRSVGDAEVMGLKVTQLLLPIGGHRISALGALKYRYNLGPLINENDTASLGFVASAGFLALIFWLFFKKTDFPLVAQLSFLNASALLFGTIGGFGALFALLISPQVRAYNRLSIFIAFFSLTAVALVLDRAYRAMPRRYPKNVFRVALILLTVIGVLDQTTTTFFFIPEYEKNRAEYVADADFVRQIESSLPTGAMIFQLPYIPFPESPPVNKMTQDQEHFKAYLHSKSLRWSYGVIKGDKDDVWQRSVVAKPTKEFVEEISKAGFSGIYINRNGYPDNAAQLESELTAELHTNPLTNRDGHLIFFSLTPLLRTSMAIR